MKQADWIKTGDVQVSDWDEVEILLEKIQRDTTVVVTGPESLVEDTGYRVRWCPGTDLEPLGGVSGDENAQIHYLSTQGDWLEIRAF